MASKGSQGSKPHPPRLVGAARDRVLDIAEGHMTALLPSSEVSLRLQKDEGLTSTQARKVMIAVRKRWAHEDANPQGRKDYKAEQVRRIMSLYRDAKAGKYYGVCAKLESLLAKMHGTLEPKKHDHRGIPAPAVAAGEKDEFDGRSIEDLDFYVEHGHFPEEATGAVEDVTAEGPTPDFPLH